MLEGKLRLPNYKRSALQVMLEKRNLLEVPLFISMGYFADVDKELVANYAKFNHKQDGWLIGLLTSSVSTKGETRYDEFLLVTSWP